MKFIYVLLSLFMFKMLSNNSNMCGEDKQLGESYARRECRENSNIRERYRKSDRRSSYSESKGGERSRYRSRTRVRDGRETTLNSGMSMINLKLLDNGVFLNEELLRNCSDTLGQIIIFYSGCPRSLMGDQELDKLKELVDVDIVRVKVEGFRFGPSKIYKSSLKAKFNMQIGTNEVKCEFFVRKGNIPIL